MGSIVYNTFFRYIFTDSTKNDFIKEPFLNGILSLKVNDIIEIIDRYCALEI